MAAVKISTTTPDVRQASSSTGERPRTPSPRNSSPLREANEASHTADHSSVSSLSGKGDSAPRHPTSSLKSRFCPPDTVGRARSRSSGVTTNRLFSGNSQSVSRHGTTPSRKGDGVPEAAVVGGPAGVDRNQGGMSPLFSDPDGLHKISCPASLEVVCARESARDAARAARRACSTHTNLSPYRGRETAGAPSTASAKRNEASGLVAEFTSPKPELAFSSESVPIVTGGGSTVASDANGLFPFSNARTRITQSENVVVLTAAYCKEHTRVEKVKPPHGVSLPRTEFPRKRVMITKESQFEGDAHWRKEAHVIYIEPPVTGCDGRSCMNGSSVETPAKFVGRTAAETQTGEGAHTSTALIPFNASGERDFPQDETRDFISGDPEVMSGTIFINEFGFELTDDNSLRKEIIVVSSMDEKKIAQREVKWKLMSESWEAAQSGKRAQKTLISRCRKGIPNSFHGIAWQLLSGSRNAMLRKKNASLYEALRAEAPPLPADAAALVEKDILSVFGNHILFSNSAGTVGVQQACDILAIYAHRDPELGYVEGLALLVATLLTQMGEEEAFWAFTALMKNPKYDMRRLFLPGLPMLQEFLDVLRRLLKNKVPLLLAHIDGNGIELATFASQWFLTLFVGLVNFRHAMRVWDVFFSEGWPIIFKIGLSLLKMNKKRLLKLPSEELLPALKKLQEDVWFKNVLNMAYKLKLKPLFEITSDINGKK